MENVNITVSDIEAKLIERMENLEKWGHQESLFELKLLMDWISCGDDY